ncbi:hypothetical protein ACERII_16020 [Evansella sp. AB-rgal1]|uniref:hypothetical protein n=1 Tax=Evansella sp. AB-rgal1 TaxID=3242696 RepID=UPI00359EAD29
MKNNKFSYSISLTIFVAILAVAIPFHLDATNNIVDKQTINEDIGGFFVDENGVRDKRFSPRQYIQHNQQEERQLNRIDGMEE